MLKIVISYMTKVRGGPDVFVVLCQDVSLLYSEVFLREIIHSVIKKESLFRSQQPKSWCFVLIGNTENV